jgi:hypothetical protein
VYGQWSERSEWKPAAGQSFPFVIVCPRCDRPSDVGEVDLRLYNPEG